MATFLSLNQIEYHLNSAKLHILSDINLDIDINSAIALVGPSGSGKTTLAKIIKGYVGQTQGSILIEGYELDAVDRVKDPRIQLVFQNPYESFTPHKTLLELLYEYLFRYRKLSHIEAYKEIEQLCDGLKIFPNHLKSYPHDLSGGELQRIALLRALLAHPKLLICDEILSALDASIKADILDLLFFYQRHRKMSILFITHDLSLVNTQFDRLAVIEEGQLTVWDNTKNVLSSQDNTFIQTSLEAYHWLSK